jgi:hypothetical protein
MGTGWNTGMDIEPQHAQRKTYEGDEDFMYGN